MSWLKQNKKTLLILLLIFIAALPALIPLFNKGFFGTDDGEWMIIRFSAFCSALYHGQFPVRFIQRLNSGYGYPVTTFLYPGFMYFGVPVFLLQAGFVNTIKIIFGLSLVGSAIFTYFWLAKIFNKTAAFIGALTALYVPYHLYDVYKRGSVGEVFALLWVPYIFWMIEKKNVFFICIGIFLLLISHNTIAVLFLPLLFVYSLLRNTLSIKQIVFSFTSGILLSSFFIIPALYELPLTQFSKIQISNPTSFFADINLIGYSTIIISILAIIIFFTKRKSLKKNINILYLFLFLSLFTLYFSSSVSVPFWKVLPSAWIQFPFRLLSYLIVSQAFLAAFLVATYKGKARIILSGIVLAALVFSALPFSAPKGYFDRPDEYYSTNEATTTVQDEYMPVWVKEKPLNGTEKKAEIIEGDGEIQNVFSNNKMISFKVNSNTESKVQVNTIYWPGWKAVVDGKESKVDYSNTKGLMTILLPKGNYSVILTFQETPLRLFADLLSLITFIILILLNRKKVTILFHLGKM